jgi:hypothetical protein
MTAALAVTAAVALAAIVAFLVAFLARRQATTRLAEERARADELSSQLQVQTQATDEAKGQATEAGRLVSEYSARLEAAERLASERGARLEAAEKGDAGIAEAFWALERVRIEREWRDVAGPTAPLPAVWDGTVQAALAVELEIIREVVGTPSSLDGSNSSAPDPAGSPPQPSLVAPAARLGGELVRELARSGDELFVDISDASPGITITIRSVANDKGPDDPALERLSAAATIAGGQLDWSPGTEELQARLRFPV